MNAYMECGDKSACILNLGTRWKFHVSAVYPQPRERCSVSTGSKVEYIPEQVWIWLGRRNDASAWIFTLFVPPVPCHFTKLPSIVRKEGIFNLSS
jgi:hypothetical protein